MRNLDNNEINNVSGAGDITSILEKNKSYIDSLQRFDEMGINPLSVTTPGGDPKSGQNRFIQFAKELNFDAKATAKMHGWAWME